MLNNVEWLNQNEQRAYPFLEGSSLTERFPVSGSTLTLPNDFIVDLRLSGTTSFIGSNNVDYFLYRMERVGNEKYILSIRQIQREIYNPSLSATYNDVGVFEVPIGDPDRVSYTYNPNVSTDTINGKIVIGRNLGTSWPVGVHEFLPSATTFEARTCVPYPDKSHVSSLGVLGESDTITGDGVLWGKTGAVLTPREDINGIRIDFVPTPDCPDPKTQPCVEDTICEQPALMQLAGATPDAGYNVHIQGLNGINVSALTQLISGGNPFDPSDYEVIGLVITYHGPITSKYISGPTNSYDSYRYGLVCSDTISEDTLAELQAQINQLNTQVNRNSSKLP